MTDQCKLCTLRGDFDACIQAECAHHNNWIALQHKERYESLLAQLEEIKEIAHPIVTNLYANEYDQTFRDVKDLHNLAITLNKKPSQSLNTLKARIEEEVIDSFKYLNNSALIIPKRKYSAEE